MLSGKGNVNSKTRLNKMFRNRRIGTTKTQKRPGAVSIRPTPGSFKSNLYNQGSEPSGPAIVSGFYGRDFPGIRLIRHAYDRS